MRVLPIFFKITSLALGQSYDYPRASASEANWRIPVCQMKPMISYSITITKRSTAKLWTYHNSDVIMSPMASQITSITIVYSTVYSGVDERKHQFRVTDFVKGIHRWPINSPHKGPVTRKCFHLVTSSYFMGYTIQRRNVDITFQI